MKKTMLPLLACALLCSCSGNNSVSTQTKTTSVGTQTSPTTSVMISVENSANNAPYVDENGLLTDSGKRRISELSDNAYTGLFDFDDDGVPEVYTVPEENCIFNNCLVCEFSGDKLTVSDTYDGIYLPCAKS